MTRFSVGAYPTIQDSPSQSHAVVKALEPYRDLSLTVLGGIVSVSVSSTTS